MPHVANTPYVPNVPDGPNVLIETTRPGAPTESAPRPARGPFVPVVPAGGSGTRLWPLSRRDRPKFLLDLTGTGRTLLQQTLDRVAPLSDRPAIVVTGAAHEAAVREQAAQQDGCRDAGEVPLVLAEPTPRNSMPAIALAAAVAVRADEDAVIGSFAADHLIADPEAFREAVRAAQAAAELGYLVTIGIEPTRPATGFGYIEREVGSADAADADALDADALDAAALAATGAVAVSRFVEKPGPELAEEFVASGRFSWNAGMFVVRARTLLDALAEQIPGLAAGVIEIAAARGTDREAGTLARVWPTLTSIAIDHALAEPLAARGAVAMVPGDFGWDDIGDFAALARQLRGGPGATDAEGAGSEGRGDGGADVMVLGGAQTLALDARATVYGSSDRLVALLGVQGVSVVDTPGALLVVDDSRAQDLGALGALLDEAGRGDLR
ncbi:mannose-1-phosphate guanylyltransferase [Brachybacterium huguangmaarense]